MAAPTNISALTATDLGTLPATVMQNVHDAGVTYEVWYAFTAPITGMVGAFASGVIPAGVGDYDPAIAIFEGPAASPVPVTASTQVTNLNAPVQFPVTQGTVYFLDISPFGGIVTVANLTLTVEAFSPVTATAGMLCVPDDAADFPLAMLSATDGRAQHYVLDFPPGEQGVSEPSLGNVLVDDNEAHLFKLYTPTLTDTGISLAHAGSTGSHLNPSLGISFGRTTPAWYAGWISSGTTMALRRLSITDLTVLDSWTLSSVTNIRALAPNAAETKLYLSGKAGLTGSAISAYDLVSPGFLADFAATITNYIATEILVLSDDTVVVLYQKSSATQDLVVKTYDSTGTVLQSASLSASVSAASVSRLTYALTDPTSFWVCNHRGDGHSEFFNLKTSDLSTLVSFTSVDFEDGAFAADPVADPQRFGASSSCPFFVFRGMAPTTATYPTRRLRRFLLPSSENNYRMFMSKLELLMETGVGLLPDAWGSTANSPQGANPQIMVRFSTDGGKTWHPEQWRSAGKRGQRSVRPRWLKPVRAYRNAVCEVVVSDPVSWRLIAALGELSEGNS